MWKKVDRGDYQIVFASPEILSESKGHFREVTMRRQSEFKKRLVLIAIDEAHTAWDWGPFRPAFSIILNRLRPAFPGVPIAAMSATFPPHVVSYVQKLARMQLPSALVTVGGRRTNIDIVVAEQHSQTDFRPLIDTICPQDMVPKNGSRFDPNDIKKTMIFAESCCELYRIAVNLRHVLKQLLPAEERHKAKEIIRMYHAGLSPDIKEEIQNWFFEGKTRIIICTDAMSLGVDFPDILRVIQWGIDGKLTLSTLQQRIGRAARDPKYYGAAVVFAPRSVIKYLAELGDYESPEQPVAENTYASPPFDLEQREIGDLTNNRFRDLSKFTLPVENTQASYHAVRQLRDHMYLTAEQKRKMEEESAGSKLRRNLRSFETFDPGLVWFLATRGCRHRVLAAYFNYPDAFNSVTPSGFCCDWCGIRQRGLDSSNTFTAGVPLSLSYLAPAPSASTTKAPALSRSSRKLSRSDVETLKPTLRENIVKWRLDVRRRLNLGFGMGVPATFVLADDVIEKVITDVNHICALNDLRDKLQSLSGKARFCLRSSVLTDANVLELFVIISTTVGNYTPSNPALPANLTQSAKTIGPVPEPSRPESEAANIGLTTATTDQVAKPALPTALPVASQPELPRPPLATLDLNVLASQSGTTSNKKTTKRKAAESSLNVPPLQPETKRGRTIFDVTSRERGSSKRIPKASSRLQNSMNGQV